MLDRLARVPPETLRGRAPFALLAAESSGRLGDHDGAREWVERALDVARARRDRQAELRAVNIQGALAFRRGDTADAEGRFQTVVELARNARDAAAEARGLNNLGILANLRGDSDAALANYQLALAAYQQAGLVRGLAETYHNVGITWRERDDLAAALAAADEAVRLARQLGDDALTSLALAGRAETHLAQGDVALAARELDRALAGYERVRYRAGLPEVWRLQAAVALAQRRPLDATRLLEAAAALARELGSAHTQAEIERDLGAALAASGDGDGARAARGRALDLFSRIGATRAANTVAALLAGR